MYTIPFSFKHFIKEVKMMYVISEQMSIWRTRTVWTIVLMLAETTGITQETQSHNLLNLKNGRKLLL